MITRLCMACGTSCTYGDGECGECGHRFAVRNTTPVQNAVQHNYAAPVQHNTVNLSVPTEVYVEREERQERAPLFKSGWVLSSALTFCSVACGLVASAVVVFIFSITFLAVARIH